jgi:hypothetical protein
MKTRRLHGEADQIEIATGDPDVSAFFWLERRGYVQDSRIEFDVKRKEVDAEVMAKQGVLDAGPLFGL